jgi:release factor glutamine methyltransferase
MLTRYRDVRLLTPCGVFEPRSDAGMLLDAACEHIRGDVLDVCTGSGVIALSAAGRATSVTAIDASRLAVAAVRLGAFMNKVAVEVLQGDLFDRVAGRAFDVILANPPYVPTPAGTSAPGSQAWDGGRDGRAVLDRLCREAPAHLRPGGDLFLVQSSLAGTEQTLGLLQRAGLTPSVAAVSRGPLGPLARSQLGHLRTIGAVHEDAVEEIVVVRATRDGPIPLMPRAG